MQGPLSFLQEIREGIYVADCFIKCGNHTSNFQERFLLIPPELHRFCPCQLIHKAFKISLNFWYCTKISIGLQRLGMRLQNGISMFKPNRYYFSRHVVHFQSKATPQNNYMGPPYFLLSIYLHLQHGSTWPSYSVHLKLWKLSSPHFADIKSIVFTSFTLALMTFSNLCPQFCWKHN